jgi:hypothetical protein
MATVPQKTAKVDLELVVNGTTFDVSHVGNHFLIVRDPCNLPPGTSGELRISVDDSLRTRSVFFPHGIPSAGVRVDWF